MTKKSKPNSSKEQAPASPTATDYVLPIQSPQCEFKLLSDALASPIQGTSSATRMTAPSSREWYTRAPLAGASDPRELSLFNSPSSGTRGSMKRRFKITNEIGIGLFGEGGERQLRQEENLFSPKLLQSPEGIPNILSPGDGYRSGGRGNVGIAFKGVDFHEGEFENLDGVQTVSSSSGSKDSFSSSSSTSFSPGGVQDHDVGDSVGVEVTGRGLRKRKASRKGRADAADVSPISDDILLDSDSHSSHAHKSSNNSDNSVGASRRKGRTGGSVLKVDSGTARFNTSPVRNFNNPRAVTPSVEGKSQVKCNCKKSKCLKLYCDCFRVSKYCEDCNCVDCNNCVEREAERLVAVNNILERNPDAFAPRIKQDAETMSKGHLSGCHCKKSACLKKYCECFSATVACSEKCRCMDCRNTPEHVAAMAAARGNSVSVSPPSAQYGPQSTNATSEIDEEMLLLAE